MGELRGIISITWLLVMIPATRGLIIPAKVAAVLVNPIMILEINMKYAIIKMEYATIKIDNNCRILARYPSSTVVFSEIV